MPWNVHCMQCLYARSDVSLYGGTRICQEGDHGERKTRAYNKEPVITAESVGRILGEGSEESFSLEARSFFLLFYDKNCQMLNNFEHKTVLNVYTIATTSHYFWSMAREGYLPLMGSRPAFSRSRSTPRLVICEAKATICDPQRLSSRPRRVIEKSILGDLKPRSRPRPVIFEAIAKVVLFQDQYFGQGHDFFSRLSRGGGQSLRTPSLVTQKQS